MAAKKVNNNATFIVIALIFLAVFLIFLIKGCPFSEQFGQEPSSRMNAGWLAGPSDGAYHRRNNKYPSRRENSNQVRSPTGSVGPENYRESHRPYNMSSGNNSKSKPDAQCNSCMSTEDFERV